MSIHIETADDFAVH